MTKLSDNEIEAANRAEVTALLIRAGFRVYRPEADVQGEDLVLRTPEGALRSVQLKSRPHVDWKKYGGRGVWMLFPDPAFKLGRDWFLIEHDLLFTTFKEWHGHTPGWSNMWNTPGVSKKLREVLEPFAQMHWTSAGLSDAASSAE
jgi:hypothetical protein